MDIEYLLYLQQFRETVGSILTPLMNAVTKLSAGFLPIAMMCMIYWAFDRKAGRKILAGLGGGLFINGFLKLTFCVYRPWIRDTRILPYGDSKTAATGYSFPSGHTTRATAMFGGSGFWFMKKGTVSLLVCCLCWYSLLCFHEIIWECILRRMFWWDLYQQQL